MNAGVWFWHRLYEMFRWPDGIVIGNLIASLIWGVPALRHLHGKLDRQTRELHEKLDAHYHDLDAYHRDLKEKLERHYRELKSRLDP